MSETKAKAKSTKTKLSQTLIDERRDHETFRIATARNQRLLEERLEHSRRELSELGHQYNRLNAEHNTLKWAYERLIDQVSWRPWWRRLWRRASA